MEYFHQYPYGFRRSEAAGRGTGEKNSAAGQAGAAMANMVSNATADLSNMFSIKSEKTENSNCLIFNVFRMFKINYL